MAPMVAILTLIRNRDCLCCYMRHRMERIENMRWDVGAMPEEQDSNLSEHERSFAREYNTLLGARAIGPGCLRFPGRPPSPPDARQIPNRVRCGYYARPRAA